MNRLSTFILPFGILLPAILPLSAQNTKSPPVPTAPYLASLKSGMQYTDTITAPALPAPKTPEEIKAQKELEFYRPKLESVIYHKGTDGTKIVYNWSGGRKSEGFIIHGVLFKASGPNYPNDVQVLNPANNASAPNYTESDFPEFNWVTASTFTRTLTEKGKRMHLYTRTSADSSNQQSVTLMIDAETLLPYQYKNGETIHLYTYTMAGSPTIDPPPAFRRVINQVVKSTSLEER